MLWFMKGLLCLKFWDAFCGVLQLLEQYLRMVYCNDMIARIPYDDEALSFKHCGLCLYYNSFYKQKLIASDVLISMQSYICTDYLEKTSTQAFIFCDKPVDARLVVVSFRGTGPFDADEWITEFDLELHQMGSLGKVHVGFLEAMGLDGRSNKQILRKGLVHDHDNAEFPDEYVPEDEKKPLAYYSIREKLKTLLEEHKDAKFLVTGHSLGGALAIFFPAILLWHKKTELLEKLLAVHTFGQPRVGDTKFGDFMNMSLNKPVTRYLRMVYCNDMIARIPYDDEALSFKHCGLCLYYNSNGSCFLSFSLQSHAGRLLLQNINPWL